MDIKNPSKGYLRDVVASTKNFLMHLPVERTRKQQEISGNSLWSRFHVRLEKASHHARRLAKKRNMCRSTLASLAFLLFFIGLNVFSLLGRQSFASATGAYSSSVTLHHSASKSLAPTPTPPSDNCSDPNNIETNQCFGGGDPGVPAKNHEGELMLGYGPSCQNLPTVSGSMCWNTKDFLYAARDNTCLQDPQANDRLKQFYKAFPGVDFNFAPVTGNSSPSVTSDPAPPSSTPTLPSPTPTPPPGSTVSHPLAQGYHQNTCVDDSSCFSNNASMNDIPDEHGVTLIHAYSGGDDITCYNNVCIQNTGNDNASCGDGVPYDRFGCVNLSINGHSSGWFYNPTAYDPPLMLERASANFRTRSPERLKASGNPPSCDNQRWTCANNTNVTVLQPKDYKLSRGDLFGDGQVLDNKFFDAIATDPGRANSDFPYTFTVFCTGTHGWIFPCANSNGQPNVGMIQKDWLSGDIGKAKGSGHLAGTFLMDTLDKPELTILFSNMLGLGYVLIAPFIILMGYQILYASWTFRHTVLLEALPRLLLSFVAISASYQLARMLLDATNFLNIAVINLHATSAMKYPEVTMGTHHYSYTLEGDGNPASFRGVVVPVSRWGCTLNDFMGILGKKLLTDLAGYVPFVGGFIRFAGGIVNMIDLFRHIGEFIMLILSINLCAQIIMRIVLINYYILTGPIVFACWALPGGVGQKVLGEWAKGFLSLLFSQTAQIFVLTSLPLLMPVLPNFPQDQFGVINIFFKQLGPIITLLAVIHVPKMMGTEATIAITQAGSVASGAVAAAGAVAYKTV